MRTELCKNKGCVRGFIRYMASSAAGFERYIDKRCPVCKGTGKVVVK